MLLTIAPFVAIRQKSAYHVKYLKMSWTYLDLLYRFGRRICGDDYPDIRLVVAQGTLLWFGGLGVIQGHRKHSPLIEHI